MSTPERRSIWKGLVYVVDDDPEVIDYISAILDDHQMKTMSASNGKEAMKRVQETKPDIILLDLLMPKQTGLGFFNELKRNAEYNAFLVSFF
jgi:CheY-like chemotaxis protein